MNVIEYGLEKINRKIPRELLQMAFPPHASFGLGDARSVLEVIKNEVIYRSFIPDLNVNGGESITVPLRNVSAEYVAGAVIYKIPLHLTNNRFISSALSINTALQAKGRVNLRNKIDTPMDMYLAPRINDAKIEVRHPNIVVFHGDPNMFGTTDLYLECMINNDSELLNLTQRHWGVIAEALVMLTKSVVYKKLVISSGEGSVGQGQISGAFRSVLDSYADMDEQYEEVLRTRVKKVLGMNNKEWYGRVISANLL